jgi:hypothetical protein
MVRDLTLAQVVDVVRVVRMVQTSPSLLPPPCQDPAHPTIYKLRGQVGYLIALGAISVAIQCARPLYGPARSYAATLGAAAGRGVRARTVCIGKPTRPWISFCWPIGRVRGTGASDLLTLDGNEIQILGRRIVIFIIDVPSLGISFV